MVVEIVLALVAPYEVLIAYLLETEPLLDLLDLF